LDSMVSAFLRWVATFGAEPGPLQDPSASSGGMISRSCQIREHMSIDMKVKGRASSRGRTSLRKLRRINARSRTASLSRLTPANSCGVMVAAEYFSRSVVDKSSDHFYLKVATTFIYNCVLKITFFRYVSRSGPL
jgi:hypothetical protein